MMNTIWKISTKIGTCMVCLVGLSACASMNAPIGDSFGVAVETNKQAQIVDHGPPSNEQPYQTGSQAAGAIERYESGETADGSDSEGSGDMAPMGMK